MGAKGPLLATDAGGRVVHTPVARDRLVELLSPALAAPGAVYVDAYSPLKGEAGRRDPTDDLLDDGDHPNASGHTLLMEAVYDALEDAGALRSWTPS